MSESKNLKPKQPIRVFISHAAADAVFARKLRNLLWHHANAQVFTTEELSAGERWEVKLRNELTAADVVVALLTPNSVDSGWLLQEMGAAWALKKPIIPVVTRRDVLNSVPVSIRTAPAIELADFDSPKSAEKFVEAFDDSVSAAHIN
jgi:nucleoside 2-deoxyribosyltransferase